MELQKYPIDPLVVGQQCKKLMEKQCAELMSHYQLRLVELDILHFLSRAGMNDTAKDIMQNMHISKAHISKSVENLRNKGYILLEEDARDHRCIHLNVTRKAEPLVEAFSESRKELLEKICAGVTEEERDCFFHVIGKVLSNLNAL